jgi:hypothetical protein
MESERYSNIRTPCVLVESDTEDSDTSDDEHDAVDAVDVRDVTQTIGGLCEVLKSKANDPCMKAHVEDFQLKITWLLEMLEAQRPKPIMRLQWLADLKPCVEMAHMA